MTTYNVYAATDTGHTVRVGTFASEQEAMDSVQHDGNSGEPLVWLSHEDGGLCAYTVNEIFPDWHITTKKAWKNEPIN